MSLFAKPKSHLSEDDFHRHWSQRHSALVSDWLAKHGVVKCIQYHTSSAAQSLAVIDFPLLEGLKRLEFDAMAEFWIPDVSCFQKARDDPYYGQVVKPDEDQLFEWETAMWAVRWEEVYNKDRKVVDLPLGHTEVS